MNRYEKIAARMVSAAVIQEGDTCTVDMGVVRSESGKRDFGTGNWVKVVRDTVRYGDGQVQVDRVSGDNAMVSAVGRSFLGPVQVPVSALKKVASKIAMDSWKLYDPMVGREAKKRFLIALKALDDAMGFLDAYSPIPPISGDYLTAQDRIESIVKKL